MHTGRLPCEDKAAAGVLLQHPQEHQRLSANHQKLGERYETDFLSKPVDVTNHLNPRLLGTKTVRQ